MPTETTTAVIDALKWRYATKKFDASKKISASDWNVLEDALQLTPSSFGLQPYKFVVITDPKVKQELVSISWNQAQVADCSHLVVFARDLELTQKEVDAYIELIAETRSVPLNSLDPMKGMMSGYINNSTPEKLAEWTARQTYIGLGNLMTAASLLNIDNCPMEGINQVEYDRVLNLKDKKCSAVMACALGYRADDDKYASLKKVRFPKEKLFVKI